MTSYTIGPGTPFSAGYPITSSGFTLTNNGIAGSTTASVGVSVVPSGDSIFNNGKIIANTISGIGVSLAQGGYVENASGATISAYKGLFSTGSSSAAVANTGSIISSGAGFGVRLNDGGLVNNNQNGFVHGGYGGVFTGGASGDVHNSGTVSGGTAGVFLRGGGEVFNYATGIVSANYAVAIGGGSGFVTNTGQINGGNLGVEESSGGTVVNQAGGTIKGALGVHIFGGAGNVSNFGTINAGASGTAVSLTAGFYNKLAIHPGSSIIGTVNGGNTIGSTASSVLQLGIGASTGTLTGVGTKYLNFTSIYVLPSATWAMGATIPTGMTLTDDGTLDNLGVVHTTATLGSGAALTNAVGAVISGSSYGVVDTAGAATVVNNGQVTASSQFSYGIALKQGGALTNQAQGVISAREAVYFGGSTAASVVNAGKILGSIPGNGDGVRLNGGGTVTNLSGTISGANGIDIISGAATVTNAGTIVSGALGKAVKFAKNFVNQLTIDPGATFSGTVDGGNTAGSATISSMVLASGTSTGTITGIGSNYVNFSNFVVNAGASWVLKSDSIPFNATVTDYGVLTNNGTIHTAVALGASASLINAKGADINSLPNAVYDNAGFATVVNDGGLGGVQLSQGGNVTNQSDGVINASIGVQIGGGGGTVANAGTIIGDNGIAVQLPAGGPNEVAFGAGGKFVGMVNGGNQVGSGPVSTLLLNPGTAAIGTLSGLGSQYLNFGHLVVAPGASWVLSGNQTIGASYTVTDNGALTNHDTIMTTLTLGSGASLTNASDGAINGSPSFGVFDAGSGAVVNAGTITGNYAVTLGGGGRVTNSGYLGGLYGVYIRKGAGTVTNLGRIVANEIGNKAVSLAPGYANSVVVGAGARFVGVVDGGNGSGSTAISTLELAVGSSAGAIGTLNGIGSEYLNFEQFFVDPGASWVIGGNQTIAASDAVTDNGTLTNNATVLCGVLFGHDASMTNDKGGTISSTQDAVVAGTGRATFVNDGLVSGFDAVALFEGGAVTNQSDGTIVGQTSIGADAIGVKLEDSSGGTVANSGLITGGSAGSGVAIVDGTVTNLAGTISGGIGVMAFLAPGTVANYATIIGTSGTAVSLAPGFTNRMVIGAGAVFTGTVDGGNTSGSATISTLELTTGSSAGAIGTLSGIGSKYLDFANIVVDAGAAWVFASGQAIAGNQALTDNGTLTNNATVPTTVKLGSGASLTNASSGTISQNNTSDGVDAAGPATVTNYGEIAGGGVAFGVEMSSGGVVINRAGTISGGNAGILILGATGTVTNYGHILAAATRTGIQLSAGGTIINRSGTIGGGIGI